MNATRRSEAGFTLIEALMAMLVLTVALMALAQVLYFGLSVAATSWRRYFSALPIKFCNTTVMRLSWA